MPNGPGELAELERRRAELYAELARVGDFRRGSLNEVRRKCGKPNCACAAPDHPGHGPQWNLTRSVGGRTRAVHLKPGPELEKARRDALAAEKAAELGRLAAEAARAMGCGDAGMEAAEQVIRAGLLKLGGSMLEQLLAADNGYRGPRVPCGQGHEAAFAGYRDKSFDTALGLITLTRAWYHCGECGQGMAPRDAGLGVAGTSMSPGLAAMNRGYWAK